MNDRIREMREEKHMNQGQMAEILNVHQTTYSDYELGNLNIPVPALIKIADEFDTSIDYLVGRIAYERSYEDLLRELDDLKRRLRKQKSNS